MGAKRYLKKLMKSIFALALALLMVITTPGVVHATTKTTSVRSAIGTYTEYVRKSNGVTELGQMTLSKTVLGMVVTHTVTFKATLFCNSATVYVSNKSGDWSTKTEAKLRNGQTVTAYKSPIYINESAAKASKTYGKCSVTYSSNE